MDNRLAFVIILSVGLLIVMISLLLMFSDLPIVDEAIADNPVNLIEYDVADASEKEQVQNETRPEEAEYMYECDGEHIEYVQGINVESCSSEFVGMVGSYLDDDDYKKVKRIVYAESPDWEHECNGMYFNNRDEIWVYYCGKDQWLPNIGDLDKNEYIEFVFLHELGHATCRCGDEAKADELAMARWER